MAQREEIRVVIRPDGSMGIDVLGAAGKHCDHVSRFLEDLGKLASKERKPEYYRDDLPPEQTTVDARTGGRP